MYGIFLYRYAIAIILVTLLISALSIYALPRLKLDMGFKQFALDGEPAFLHYENFTHILGSTDNSFVLAIQHEPTIFDAVFLEKLQKLQYSLDSLHWISGTMTLLDLKKYTLLFPGYYHKRPYIQVAHPERFTQDSLLIFEDYPLTQHFISKDNAWTKLIFQVHDDLPLLSIDSMVQKIDQITSDLSFGETHMMGRKYMESEFKKLTNSELKVFLVLSLLFMVLVLWLLYRSIAGVLLPILCMVISLLMLYGYLAIMNRQLTILSNLFPTIITIIGISNVIHISGRCAQESLFDKNRITAIDKSIKEVGLTTLVNTLTTAIGFLTLLAMSMKAMRSFGVDAAVGLGIAWINSVFLLPALLVRFNLAKSFIRPSVSRFWGTILEWMSYLVSKYPKTIAASFGAVVIVFAFGSININTNNLVFTSLPENNRLAKDFDFFEKRLGGGRTLELIIKPQSHYHMYDQLVIENILKLEKYLEDELGVEQIISPALAVRWLHRTSDRKNDWNVPVSTNFRLYKEQLASVDGFLPITLVDSTGTVGRLTGRLLDGGRKTMEKKFEKMNEWINNNIENTIVMFQLTGSDYLTDIGHQRRIENMVIGFLLEVLVVALIIGLLYRSGLLVFITFIANIVPIIFVAGFMGFTGIELRGSITIIFAIGYVIATDDTLHFINKYRLERRKGLSNKEAIRITLLTTGRAMVATSLILLGGFLILLYSSFGDVYYHGVLVSIIIIVALLTDLLLTPVLLDYFFREKPDPVAKSKQSEQVEIFSHP
jgi:uncharacterized protein